jgi:hypothetical protein
MPFMGRSGLLLLGVAVVALAACREEEPAFGELDGSPPVPDHCDVPPPPEGVTTVQVVYSCDESPVGSWRPVPAGTADTIRFALDALLEGPTTNEEESGLASFFSYETAGMINDVAVRDGVAFIDFQDFSAVIPNASTSAGSRQLLDQIAGTIFQFDHIREAQIGFNSSCDAFWNWLQRDCQRLTREEH